MCRFFWWAVSLGYLWSLKGGKYRRRTFRTSALERLQHSPTHPVLMHGILLPRSPCLLPSEGILGNWRRRYSLLTAQLPKRNVDVATLKL